jgi:hypothetical protein
LFQDAMEIKQEIKPQVMSREIFMKTLLKDKKVNWTYNDSNGDLIDEGFKLNDEMKRVILENSFGQLLSYYDYYNVEYKNYYDAILNGTKEISCRISNEGDILLTFKDHKKDIWSLSVTYTKLFIDAMEDAMSLDNFMKTLLKDKEVKWTFTLDDEKARVLLKPLMFEYPQRLLILLENAFGQLQSYDREDGKYEEILARTTEISCKISNGDIMLTFKDKKEDIWRYIE